MLPCLHDAAGGQWVAHVAGAGGLAVLAHGLVAAAVGLAAPLHGGAGVGGQAAQQAGVDGERRQAVVREQHRLAPAGGAGDELVLGTGLVQDLQTFLAHGVQAGTGSAGASRRSCRCVRRWGQSSGS